MDMLIDRPLDCTNAPRLEARAELMLRGIEPDLFAKCYVIAKGVDNRHALPVGNEDAYGWTATDLDLRCQSYLESCSRWEGRGFAMISNAFMLGDGTVTESRFLGNVVHEAAHYARWQVLATAHEDTDPPFIRALLHLSHRATNWHAHSTYRLTSAPIGPANAALFSLSGLSPMHEYLHSLEFELEGSERIHICDHLQRVPSVAFQDICNHDARQAGRALPFPAAAQRCLA